METQNQKIDLPYCSRNGRKKFTYIMLDKGNQKVKVGKSNNPARRMAEHAAGPESSGKQNWMILAVFDADEIDEGFLCRNLCQGRGEWTKADSEIRISVFDVIKLVYHNQIAELGFLDD